MQTRYSQYWPLPRPPDLLQSLAVGQYQQPRMGRYYRGVRSQDVAGWRWVSEQTEWKCAKKSLVKSEATRHFVTTEHTNSTYLAAVLPVARPGAPELLQPRGVGRNEFTLIPWNNLYVGSQSSHFGLYCKLQQAWEVHILPDYEKQGSRVANFNYLYI